MVDGTVGIRLGVVEGVNKTEPVPRGSLGCGDGVGNRRNAEDALSRSRMTVLCVLGDDPVRSVPFRLHNYPTPIQAIEAAHAYLHA